MVISVAEFVRKWQRVALTERSASQQHFLDLCELFDHPKPAEADPIGESFTFERGASKHGGGEGWADVWKRGFFGWEYKGRHRDLDAAHEQLLKYREALENPPLLVVCDMDRFVIRTNFTNTPTQTHEFSLDGLAEPRNLEILRCVFNDPDKLRPGATSEAITAEAATKVAAIAQLLRSRGLDPHSVARFLDRLVFCLFAEDVGLLPGMIFTRMLEKTRHDPARFAILVAQLFEAMAKGGDFGIDTIRHFDGHLFEDVSVLELTEDELRALNEAARLDWETVDPSVFGTLFERGMDPEKRSQLGAHYTSRADIETLVEPVVMTPLRRNWAEVRQLVDNLLATGKKHPTGKEKGPPSKAQLGKASLEAQTLIHHFLIRLSEVKVLDPACGSGNFLYVTLQRLKDLEKEVIVYAMDRQLGAYLPMVGPWQMHGIEISPYAFELAQTTIWIGYLQWTRVNGFGITQTPVLKPMDTFECRDAILDLTDPDNPKEPEWPAVDFIVGNPPFLGNKLIRSALGDAYSAALWRHWRDRIPAMSDLCCYWHEKARSQIEAGRCRRAGLLATATIRQVGSRRVLERVCSSTDIFFAVSDRDWVLDGAAVRISMIGFGHIDGGEQPVLDGEKKARINPDLTAGVDLSCKQTLDANTGLCFMGTTKVGAFDVEHSVAVGWLNSANPHNRPNSDVLRPFRNGSDVVRRSSERWILDFGVATPHTAAALYEQPFEYAVKNVKPKRTTNNDPWRATNWWLLGRTLPGFRKAVEGTTRYIGTPRVSKHRLFVWLDTTVLPDSKLIAIALHSDYDIGVLQSRIHEVWTLATCGWHGIGDDVTYNPTECFETFSFPDPPADRWEAIAEAARELDQLRSKWLNPPEWTREEVLEFPGSVDGPWSRYVHDPDSRGIGTVRYPRVVPRDEACAQRLKPRTLTKLYNERPTWLDLAHRRLDEAVFAAYGWPTDLADDEILERLLGLNLDRAPTERA